MTQLAVNNPKVSLGQFEGNLSAFLVSRKRNDSNGLDLIHYKILVGSGTGAALGEAP